MLNPADSGDFAKLREEIRQFVAERDWDQFHTPKNLSSALCVEAAELLEHFQWLPTGSGDELNPAKLQQVRHEMADVLVYLIRLADKLDVDLSAAVSEKMVLNRSKYPADKVRGDARKYSEYEDD
ncbi:NTP pyrophosphatase, house-cleaning of non-canonical NTPs [Collimonas sp. OK242]|jgi:NTP pyrophosphatase (non-canonical NTP hydrolase)|uniref:nucleotide pyrophosphohydrolase n=1 Tax=Collimonas sp. OK242 TaxID=1798195 RepID=UPI0008963135|nr:nucleotide pyrophosphohydrolase [Collimonas sp. OK242]SDY60379.1 NTP pyrophosphatase, house-cleaning of non-canonical NTPs [Collimonas sp. OK242]